MLDFLDGFDRIRPHQSSPVTAQDDGFAPTPSKDVPIKYLASISYPPELSCESNSDVNWGNFKLLLFIANGLNHTPHICSHQI